MKPFSDLETFKPSGWRQIAWRKLPDLLLNLEVFSWGDDSLVTRPSMSKTSIEGLVKLSLNPRSVQLDRKVLNIAGIPYPYDEKGS